MTDPEALSDSTRLAIDRTRLAHERTLMAWARTAVSLISFGFTVYKFFQAMEEEKASTVNRLFGPRPFALFLIGIGLLSLILATIQHQRQIHQMRVQYPTVEIPLSMATFLGFLVSGFGVVALLAVVFRQ